MAYIHAIAAWHLGIGFVHGIAARERPAGRASTDSDEGFRKTRLW